MTCFVEHVGNAVRAGQSIRRERSEAARGWSRKAISMSYVAVADVATYCK